jgi:hypothetical protein
VSAIAVSIYNLLVYIAIHCSSIAVVWHPHRWEQCKAAIPTKAALIIRIRDMTSVEVMMGV